MLSRRQLRIKVLQSLYAFFQSEKSDLAAGERELFRSIEKVNELYIYILLFLTEIGDSDQADAEDVHLKFFPRAEELKTHRRLYDLKFTRALSQSEELKRIAKTMKISWQTQQDLIRKIFLEIKKSEEYHQFLINENVNEKDFVLEITKKFIAGSEALQHHIEEQNIFWNDDFEFVMQLVIRTIRTFYDNGKLDLIPLYKDEEEDKDFARQLFHQTILNNKEFEQSISERTKNWEVDRIALMDILILKMALAELTTFSNIPVKVSINEFIDISKEYSTPKSKQFVNGVLDKLAGDYREKGRIVKTGRGLLE